MRKHFDPITQTAALAFITLLLLVLAFWQYKQGNKPVSKALFVSFAAAGIATAIRGITALNSPALILENDYTGNGCYKCESETECIIRPLAQLDAQTAVDGINTGARPGAVFKLSNGIHARITASGDARPYSMVSRWFAGWRDRAYFEKKGVLAQWQPLFDCQLN